MKTTIAAAAVLCVGALVAGCGNQASTPGTEDDPSTSAPAELPAHVVVFSPDEVGEYGPDANWTPDADDVAAAEDLLAEVVRPRPGDDQRLQPLRSYVRQYAGVSGDELMVNGLCDDSLAWREMWIQVFDGGACYWNARIADGEVASFSVNGLA